MMVLSRFFDAEPTAVMPRSDHWVPHAPAGRVATARAAVRDDLRAAVAGVRAAGSLGRHPVGSAQWLLGVGRGMLGYAGSLRPARSRQLSGSLGSLRRYRVARADLDAVRRVKTALGGSVNDVVLAIVTTGLRDLLLERGERPAPGAVRCLVPVSVRMPSEAEHVDNRVSALLADLPVEFDDPLTRYGAMVARTRDLKASHEAEAGSVLTAVAGYVPPALMDSVLRAYVRLPQRIVTTVITNVPGPHEVRYVLGRRMVALYPYVPIADRLRVGIAVTSYDGQLFFGITADRASVADIDVLQTGLERGLDELVRSARAESESFDRTPVEGTP
jgi:diacylglycerol O-acyltransferase